MNNFVGIELLIELIMSLQIFGNKIITSKLINSSIIKNIKNINSLSINKRFFTNIVQSDRSNNLSQNLNILKLANKKIISANKFIRRQYYNNQGNNNNDNDDLDENDR